MKNPQGTIKPGGFLTEEALIYQKELLGEIYLVLHKSSIVAFFTLSMGNIRVQKIPIDMKIVSILYRSTYI